MEFGIQFFPDVGPEDKSPEAYFRDSLDLVELAEPLGFSHIRIVEHYFHYYGGYSPNPMLFLAAASQRTRRARLVTGAVIPAFNHPLKLAAEIAMLDGISGGRLDVGFARAFLPHEFRHFGISPDESVARYREGIEQIDLLLREADVTHEGVFHRFAGVTSLPRPTQRPRPKFYVAATMTRESFEYAGRMGYSIMAIPMAAEKLRESIDAYRDAWRAAGHPGRGEVMLAFHMFVDEDGERARRVAKPNLEGYFASLISAGKEWTQGMTSTDYQGYDKKYEHLARQTLETMIESCAALIGTPREVCAQLHRLSERIGGFEHASLQVNFHRLDQAECRRSMELFGAAVIPRFREVPAESSPKVRGDGVRAKEETMV